MRIVVTGTRGIPNILGGVETHCENLYPIIARHGHEVILIRRKAYVREDNRIDEYKGVKLVDIWTPKQKSLEAIIHTFLAVLYAKKVKADVMHVHAVGPALIIPFAKLLGLKVVMTNHGPDYDRQKWNILAKKILRLGEYLGVRFADKVIVISEVINEIVIKRYRKAKTDIIFNGVEIPVMKDDGLILKKFGLKKKKYIVAVGRFVPEKGFHDLIEAYSELGIKEKLVLVGDADHKSEYSERLKNEAAKLGIVLTGFQTGDNLKELFGNAKLFVLPSYHEGLPIVLLEAMSYGLNLLVSDIPANKVVGLSDEDYFSVGNVNALKKQLLQKLQQNNYIDYRNLIIEKYNWDRIAKDTIDVYNEVI